MAGAIEISWDGFVFYRNGVLPFRNGPWVNQLKAALVIENTMMDKLRDKMDKLRDQKQKDFDATPEGKAVIQERLRRKKDKDLAKAQAKLLLLGLAAFSRPRQSNIFCDTVGAVADTALDIVDNIIPVRRG